VPDSLDHSTVSFKKPSGGEQQGDGFDFGTDREEDSLQSFLDEHKEKMMGIAGAAAAIAMDQNLPIANELQAACEPARPATAVAA
jgi:hypothetical protein